MSSIDKNQAIIEYLATCPYIQGTQLFFNLINAQDNNVQIITTSEDKMISQKPYIDGSVAKRYTFNLIVFKSITDSAIVMPPIPAGTSVSTSVPDYPNENVDDLAEVQALIDWVQEQEDARNYPDFGANCYIDEIMTTTDEPQFDGINDEMAPPLAMYSMSIVVNYIDESKVIFR